MGCASGCASTECYASGPTALISFLNGRGRWAHAEQRALLPDGTSGSAALQYWEISYDPPPSMIAMMQQHSLQDEFAAIWCAVNGAPKGKRGAWKASNIARALWAGGFERKCRAKGIDLHLVREKRTFACLSSKKFLCLAASSANLSPDNVYNDAAYIAWPSWTISFPSGVFGQQLCSTHAFNSFDYDAPHPRNIEFIDPMPVAIARLLETTGAAALDSSFRERVSSVLWPRGKLGNEGVGNNLAAILASFRDDFKACGLAVWACQSCHSIYSELSDDMGAKVHGERYARWIEYVDLASAQECYVPEYGLHQLEVLSTKHKLR